MKNKHLNFYKSVMKNDGRLPKIKTKSGYYYQLDGLCECAEYKYIDDSRFKLFKPTMEELNISSDESLSRIYWADGVSLNGSKSDTQFDRTHILTPLRQNIVLFMAVLNENEY